MLACWSLTESIAPCAHTIHLQHSICTHRTTRKCTYVDFYRKTGTHERHNRVYIHDFGITSSLGLIEQVLSPILQ